jgi:hypothetical protein
LRKASVTGLPPFDPFVACGSRPEHASRSPFTLIFLSA